MGLSCPGLEHRLTLQLDAPLGHLDLLWRRASRVDRGHHGFVSGRSDSHRGGWTRGGFTRVRMRLTLWHRQVRRGRLSRIVGPGKTWLLDGLGGGVVGWHLGGGLREKRRPPLTVRRPQSPGPPNPTSLVSNDGCRAGPEGWNRVASAGRPEGPVSPAMARLPRSERRPHRPPPLRSGRHPAGLETNSRHNARNVRYGPPRSAPKGQRDSV